MPALELDPTEARILGVLIEKELTTPDQYPLSLNALASGCNQKSNRDPVLELSDSEIMQGIERLRRKSLVGVAHAAGARVERYKHAANTVWELAQPELAVVAELMLRGRQMPGELRSRASRMSPIETLEALGSTLENLRARGFVRRIEPLPGERAPSWEQILAAAPKKRMPGAERESEAEEQVTAPTPAVARPASAPPAGIPASAPATGGLEARVVALEAEVARLARLYDELSRR